MLRTFQMALVKLASKGSKLQERVSMICRFSRDGAQLAQICWVKKLLTMEKSEKNND